MGDQTDSKQTQTGQSTPQDDSGQTQFGVQKTPTGTFSQDDLNREVRRAETRIGQQWRQRMEEQEVKEAGDNTDLVKNIRAMHEARRLSDEANQKILDAEEREQKANKALAQAQSLVAEHKAQALAKEHNVDAQKLLRYSGGNVEVMEELAKELKGASANEPPNPPNNPPLHPDNNETAGGGNLSLESLLKLDISKMNQKQLKEHQEAIRRHTRGASW